MKNKIDYILFLLIVLLINVQVNAAENYYQLEAEDEVADCLLEDKCIPYGSYVIGTYLFAPEEDGASAVFDDSQVIAATATIIKDEYRDMFNKSDYRSWYGAYGTSMFGSDEAQEPFGEGVTSICITHINGEKIDGATCPTKTNANNTATFVSTNDSGQDVSKDVYFTDGATVVPPAPTERYGYNFVCWTLDDGTNVDSRDCYEFTGATPNNSRFEAKYEAIEYIVKYDLNGGTGTVPNDSVCNIDLEKMGGITGENCLFRELEATKAGYKFVGWSLVQEDSEQYFTAGQSIINMLGENNDVTLYAVWAPETYNISYVLNSGVAINPTTYTYSPQGVTIELSNPVREDYVFKNWEVSSKDSTVNVTLPTGTSNTLTISGYGKFTLSATYTEKEVRFVYNNDNLATCKYLDNNCTLPDADDVTSGYEFTGWRVSDTDVILKGTFNVHIFDVEEVNLEKVETPISKKITYDLDGGVGGNYVTTYTIEDKNIGKDLGLVNTPVKSGYTFDKWVIGDEEFAWSKVSEPISDITIKAIYTPNNISVVFKDNTSETSKNCVYGSDCIINVADPTMDNSEFAGWLYNGELYQKDDNIKDVIGTGGRVVFVSQFTHSNDYVIHYDLLVDDAYISSNAITQIAPDSDSITLTTPYRKGYVFDQWYVLNENGEYVETNSISGNLAVNNNGEKAIFLKASWHAVSYTFNFSATGKDGIDSVTCQYDSDCTLGVHDDLDYDADGIHYTFVGWATNDGSAAYVDDYNVKNMFDINTEVDLVAQYAVTSHKIMYFYNGGTETGNPTRYYVTGDTITFPEDPVKEGYVFTGWVGIDGNEITPSDVSTLDEDVVVLAQFRLITKFDVKFVDGYTGAVIASQECSHYEDCIINVPEDPVRNGYRFDGWSNFDGKDETQVQNITNVNYREMVFEANWDNRVAVQFEVDGEVEETKYCVYGDTCNFSDKIVTKDNAKLIGWTNETYDVSNINITDVSISSILFTAAWDTTYDVKFMIDGNVYQSEECTYGVECNITVTDPTKENSIFLGWKNGEETFNGSITNSNINIDTITYTAEWNDKYTVNFKDDVEVFKTQECTFGVACEITVTDPTKENNRFLGWQDGENHFEGTVTNNDITRTVIDYFATWTDKYTVNFKNDTELVQTQECTYGVACEVTVTDPVKENNRFLGWQDGENHFEGTVTNNDISRSIVEYFAIWTNEYSIEFKDGENVKKEETGYFGTAYDFSDYELEDKENAKFVGWTIDGTTTITSVTITDLSTDVVTINALWDDNYHVVFKDGETVIKEKDCVYGEECTDDVTIPSTSENRFDGWLSGSYDYTNFTVTDLSVDEVVFIAQWTPIIRVEFRDGDTLLDHIDCYAGESCDLSSVQNPTKSGYRFTGWTPNLETSITIAEDALSPITYTANWSNEYVVRFVSEYSSEEVEENVVTCTYSSEAGDCDLNGIEPASRSGYRFTGWSNDDFTYTGDFYTMEPVEEIVFVSDWTDRYQIKFFEGTTQVGETVDAVYGAASDLSDYRSLVSVVDLEGNPFRGWTSTPTGITYQDSFTFNDTSIGLVKFTAIYESYSEYNVSFYNGETLIGTVPVVYGTPYSRVHIEEGDIAIDGNNYYISGWSSSSDSSVIDYEFDYNFGSMKSQTDELVLYAVVDDTEEYYTVGVSETTYHGDETDPDPEEGLGSIGVFMKDASLEEYLDDSFDWYLDSGFTQEADLSLLLNFDNWSTIVAVNDENTPQLKGNLILYGKKVVSE